MAAQVSMFDYAGRVLPIQSARASRASRDEAMARVEVHADAAWSELAAQTVRSVARGGGDFTSDDVWAAGLPRPSESRALGPVLMRLARDGEIVAVGFRQTTQVSRNAAPVRVWRLSR